MTDRINEKLGAWLLREGNTRELLAHEIGISRPALLARLNGTSKWYWEEVVRVAKLTESDLNDLAGINQEAS